MKLSTRNDLWRLTWLALAFWVGTYGAVRILQGQIRAGELAQQSAVERRLAE